MEITITVSDAVGPTVHSTPVAGADRLAQPTGDGSAGTPQASTSAAGVVNAGPAPDFLAADRGGVADEASGHPMAPTSGQGQDQSAGPAPAF